MKFSSFFDVQVILAPFFHLHTPIQVSGEKLSRACSCISFVLIPLLQQAMGTSMDGAVVLHSITKFSFVKFPFSSLGVVSAVSPTPPYWYYCLAAPTAPFMEDPSQPLCKGILTRSIPKKQRSRSFPPDTLEGVCKWKNGANQNYNHQIFKDLHVNP